MQTKSCLQLASKVLKIYPTEQSLTLLVQPTC